MTRLIIVVPLALLLSVSPILPSMAAYICCCDDAPGSFHLHHQEHAHRGHDHSAAPAPIEASQHSDDDGEHHRGSHHEHDADQSPGLDVAPSAHASVPAPGSCSCSEADLPTPESVAVLSVAETSCKSTKLASGHVALAIKVTLDHLYLDGKVDAISDVSPPAPHLFLVNSSFLI